MVNDSRGQAVQVLAKDKSVTRFSIDIGQCVTGVYTISVIAKEGTSTTKVIKK
ncbi:T9SS type A sorting domain-containing protein [Parabacteroides sp. FAFU027]|uniref:T9SS type A sorting domain-containing protein n=1 Tax=Parabacteroides sp. FAFU027 TaxID=2922715 RepID=UPI001FAED344|nr:T9SS type A sorting domain-containing protein [Parabacteroides sp. FAFU027]